MNAADFRRIALSLEGAEEGSHFGAADFRVGGHIFATLAAVKQGYGNLMLTPELQEAFVAEQPEIFLPIPGGWGKGGATRRPARRRQGRRAHRRPAHRVETARREEPEIRQTARLCPAQDQGGETSIKKRQTRRFAPWQGRDHSSAWCTVTQFHSAEFF